MEEILHTTYSAYLEEMGRRTEQSLNFTACAGENVYLYGNPGRRQLHFDILCGLRKPDFGSVYFPPQPLYALPKRMAPAFRRDNIGAIPYGGGLIPELPMLPQVILPLKLAGLEREAILARLQELISDRIPLHSLYTPPSRSNPRKQAYASIFRAVIRKPKVIVVNGFLDIFEELDADLLWEALLSLRPKESVLIYLSGAPAPEQVAWTQQLKL